MENNLFERFSILGKLILPSLTVNFNDIAWTSHPTFDGVQLKHLITGNQTNNVFSYHLVKINPNKKIGIHTHPEQLETHEVIAGSGYCINDGKKIEYKTGIITVFNANITHEVIADANGLYLFAKFMPALT